MSTESNLLINVQVFRPDGTFRNVQASSHAEILRHLQALFPQCLFKRANEPTTEPWWDLEPLINKELKDAVNGARYQAGQTLILPTIRLAVDQDDDPNDHDDDEDDTDEAPTPDPDSDAEPEPESESGLDECEEKELDYRFQTKSCNYFCLMSLLVFFAAYGWFACSAIFHTCSRVLPYPPS